MFLLPRVLKIGKNKKFLEFLEHFSEIFQF